MHDSFVCKACKPNADMIRKGLIHSPVRRWAGGRRRARCWVSVGCPQIVQVAHQLLRRAGGLNSLCGPVFHFACDASPRCERSVFRVRLCSTIGCPWALSCPHVLPGGGTGSAAQSLSFVWHKVPRGKWSRTRRQPCHCWNANRLLNLTDQVRRWINLYLTMILSFFFLFFFYTTEYPRARRQDSELQK